MTRTDLVQAIRDSLLKALPELPISVIRVIGERAEGQCIDLQLGDAEIRIRSERGWYEILFSSVVDGEWFGSGELLEFFGRPGETLDAQDRSEALDRTRVFLRDFGGAVAAVFSTGEYPSRKAELLEARRRRNLRIAPGRGRHR